MFIQEKRPVLKEISENVAADDRTLGIGFYPIWCIPYAACAILYGPYTIYNIRWKPLPEKPGQTQNETKQIENPSEWIDSPTEDYFPPFSAIFW